MYRYRYQQHAQKCPLIYFKPPKKPRKNAHLKSSNNVRLFAGAVELVFFRHSWDMDHLVALQQKIMCTMTVAHPSRQQMYCTPAVKLKNHSNKYLQFVYCQVK